jgi:hypothetical protein
MVIPSASAGFLLAEGERPRRQESRFSHAPRHRKKTAGHFGPTANSQIVFED